MLKNDVKTDLFQDLQIFVKVTPDRHGECHISCPGCKKEPARGQVHFSFSEKGGYCFVCGFKCSLPYLAKELGMGDRIYQPPPPQPEKPRQVYSWMAYAERHVRQFEEHPERFELWQAHKPVSVETIERMRLGVGVLPASSCHHLRLIVPVIDGTMIVGLRGRRLNCRCAKWTASAGSTLNMLPLYNEQTLEPRRVVWIVENCVDALMIGQVMGFVGLATYSVVYWRKAWTEKLVEAWPELIVVAYDNDEPGRKNGARLANTLLEAGLDAVMYPWGDAPEKMDIGTILMGGTH